MFKKLIYFVSVVLLLGSFVQAEDIKWTDLGADHLWSTPENWDLGRVPTLEDEILIDVPAAAVPNGPVIQDGIDAKAKGIWTEAPGEPSLTITGGTLEVAEWIWLGDGTDSFGIWDMTGGAVTVGSEFELGWGGGAGTLTMTGGTISAGDAVIPTGSGAFGALYLYGGTYNVTNADGLGVNENGLIDITEGTLILEGDDTVKINDLIAAGLITANGGAGQLELDFDVRNPGKTTLTATIEKTVLFTEDFEGLPLGPNVDEALAGDAVWTDTPPEGWIVDESGIPGIGMDETDGVTEWAGWAFADKAWWIETAGDQDRSLFELGSGIVAIADPDEWDDGERLPIPISADPYDTWLTTPAIDISDAEPGTLELKFDSSWRPEFDDNYHQTANITASFDGGDPVVVMLWESDEASDNFHPYATNETVIVKLDRPEGAKKVVLTFGLFDAGNDWWWAIDNIEVRGVVLDQGPVNPGTDGLVASYALDGDATDGSGNGLDGTIIGDAVFADGMIGMALDLDGVDDYVDCGTNETLNTLSDAITVSAWVNIRSVTTTWMGIVMKGETAWRLGVNGDTTGIHWGFTGGARGWQQANSVTELPFGEWHHIAGTYDKGVGGIVWIDGVAEAENADPDGVAGNEQPLLLGENPEALGRLFDGLLDDVRIYDRALSEAELRYLAGERAVPVDPGDNGLLAWWACDEGEGTVVADISGNGRDGTIVNGDPVWVEGVSGTAVELVGPTLVEILPLDIELSEATMAGWIKPNGAQPDWSSIIMTRDPGPATGLNILGFQLAYHWNDTSDSWSFRGGDMIAEDDWTFAAVTIESDKATFYVNGETGSVNEVTHEPILWNSNIYLGGDGTAGWVSRRMNGALDEVVMYDRALSAGEIRYLAGKRLMDDLLGPDVTGLGDVVQGVPNDGDWPGAETPDLAVDDNTGTKYLHFKGETEPTGFQIEPLSGASIVTGLTFTTANDATERDPISFELSGSNESIDGPYELIASGDIVDFAQEDAWPRFTMNTTPITFDNNVAYKYYQVMFPAVRDPGSANSMQIAEVELRAGKF